MRNTTCAALFILFACFAGAQSDPAVAPVFDAAAIKSNPTGGGRLKLLASPGGRLTAENMPLRLLIMNAYGVRDFQISGGPAWITSDRFDITATSEGNPTEKQVLGPMLQSLLEDRFKLKVHRETKELPVFNLAVAKNGPHLPDSKPGDCTQVGPSALPLPCGDIVTTMSPDGSRLRGEKAGMAQLAFTLTNILGRTVIDKTAFTGKFDIDLAVNLDDVPTALKSFDIQPVENPTASSIFSTLPRELGLKLENAKGPVEVLVIDHVEKPTGN